MCRINAVVHNTAKSRHVLLIDSLRADILYLYTIRFSLLSLWCPIPTALEDIEL